ncbi:MAG: hypothetical protein OXE81_14140 [Gammaproteobacteria bacterium]|nr:hypothetical protein [Gammaproteobacteria bacterium]
MSERERRLAENGAGPKGCRLSKSRSEHFGACEWAFSALAQATTASAGIVLTRPNWKASANWPKKRSDEELDGFFDELKKKFDEDRDVFKGTRSYAQLLKQAEFDVVGVDLAGDVHAAEVSYHHGGLKFEDGPKRVLKKLRAFQDYIRSAEGRAHPNEQLGA